MGTHAHDSSFSGRFREGCCRTRVATTTATAAASASDVRYKVWVALGPERLELPTTYTGIRTHIAINVKEGEEKMARKVLRHLRLRDVGEGMERVGSDRSKYPICLPPSSTPFTSFLSPAPYFTFPP